MSGRFVGVSAVSVKELIEVVVVVDPGPRP